MNEKKFMGKRSGSQLSSFKRPLGRANLKRPLGRANLDEPIFNYPIQRPLDQPTTPLGPCDNFLTNITSHGHRKYLSLNIFKSRAFPLFF